MTTGRIATIAGASGFIGTALRKALETEGYEIRTIGRSGPVRWGDADAIRAAVDGADLLVGLAGKPIDSRFTDRNRDEILRSRVETTRELHAAVADSENPPRVWINASTAAILRTAMDGPQDDVTGEIGWGFTADVARAWEDAFFAGDLPHTRRAAFRISIAIGDGPATKLFLTLGRLGLGGPQHDGWWPHHDRYRGTGPHPSRDSFDTLRTNGHQRVSWVHIDDLVRAVQFVRDHDAVDGPIVLATPETPDNREFMAAVRRAVGMPVGLPSWRFMVEPAMWVMRTESELVFQSRWVTPTKLTDAGFVFEHTDLEQALREVAARGKAKR
ncbi:DUF1731 domain-containing protein [Microbacterium indicum]|uniref:DUF1731 domain-containing protein n=1 Tax=Microbacterium indicum TaxID=358100 RepID=UPI000414957A|nr:DUF1731 domain-containing protein [Microbacterium indicum]